jgi:hypothetical protein
MITRWLRTLRDHLAERRTRRAIRRGIEQAVAGR